MKSIITISRQFGAGGGQIGKAVAERLGYYYLDKDMIIRSAVESSSLTPEDFRIYDERVPFNFGFGQSLFDFYSKPLNERLFAAQREAILKAGEKGRCVIVGRNANVVLKEFDRSLHVFISASRYFRLQNLKGKMPDFPEERILEEMKSVDKTRRKYCTFYTKTEFGNAAYYDLCLKSSTLGIERCVNIICELAESE
ncbi:MAG: cytidylate kinase-like family protein [Lachnospiraceae bacterium]|nr:cytidylate kinase-like family protein [Lachnospiraceae bacterium]